MTIIIPGTVRGFYELIMNGFIIDDNILFQSGQERPQTSQACLAYAHRIVGHERIEPFTIADQAA